jgi:Family of unknown function (DUF6526)
MEKEKPQNFKNHGRVFPPFHFFVLPLFLVNLIYRLVELKNGVSFASVFDVLLALGFITMAISLRIMVLSVQDRVIRLEMQLRLDKLLPADLRSRAGEFTVEQLIGLRFAADDELSSLCRQVLDEKIANRKTIKSRVKTWRPDYLRA